MSNWIDNIIFHSGSKEVEDLFDFIMVNSGYEFSNKPECMLGDYGISQKVLKFCSKWEPDWKIIGKLMRNFPNEIFTIFSIDTANPGDGWYLIVKDNKILDGAQEEITFTPDDYKLLSVFHESSKIS